MEIKNYITPTGHQRIKDELLHLLDTDRPTVVKTVTWAASNGDRSENADYQYGKKRLREIDRRIYFLTKRLEDAVVVDPETREQTDQIFFGATVTFADEDGTETTVSIVGVDEVNMDKGHVSWISPIAKALIKAREGDTVKLMTPKGMKAVDILSVTYQKLS
jgi:transcription elongation factor GreB